MLDERWEEWEQDISLTPVFHCWRELATAYLLPTLMQGGREREEERNGTIGTAVYTTHECFSQGQL